MLCKVRVAAIIIAGLCVYGQAPPDRGGYQADLIWGPPQVEWPIIRSQPTVPKEMIGNLKIAGWPIVLEETELIAAQKHFGGAIGDRGDAGDALEWLCLYRRDKESAWVLWLESSEIDGPTIGGFRWQQIDTSSKMDERCQLLPGDRASVSLPLALRPGMREADVLAVLGPPSLRNNDMAVYEHEHNVTIGSEPYDVSNIVIVTYRGGKIWAVEVWHSTVS